MVSAHDFKLKHSQLTATAQKVYAAVPISEPWSISYIMSEMQRAGTSTKDMRVVAGCLASLKDSKLIAEPARGQFVRVAIRAETVPAVASLQPEKKMHQVTPAASVSAVPRTPVAILSTLADRAKALSTMAKKLADDIETAALEIEELASANDEEIQKLRQLRTLLKGLN